MSPTLPTPLLFLSFLVPDSDGQVIPLCGPRSPLCNVGQGSQTSATLPLSGLCLAHSTASLCPSCPQAPRELEQEVSGLESEDPGDGGVGVRPGRESLGALFQGLC